MKQTEGPRLIRLAVGFGPSIGPRCLFFSHAKIVWQADGEAGPLHDFFSLGGRLLDWRLWPTNQSKCGSPWYAVTRPSCSRTLLLLDSLPSAAKCQNSMSAFRKKIDEQLPAPPSPSAISLASFILSFFSDTFSQYILISMRSTCTSVPQVAGCNVWEVIWI